MTDKYGVYIQKLMAVILDDEQEEFVKKSLFTFEMFTFFALLKVTKILF